MSSPLDNREAHQKAINLSNLYKELNQKTKYNVLPQSESDRKLKIRRIAVVQRDEQAIKITSKIKTEAQAFRSKEDRSKKAKTSVQTKTTKAQKEKAKPKPRIISKSKVQQPPHLVPATQPVSSRNYRLIDDLSVLKPDSLVGQAWEMYKEGKDLQQIAQALNVNKKRVSHFLFTRRRQLGIETPPRVYTSKGVLKEGTKSEAAWNLFIQGKSVEQIAVELESSKKSVSILISRRKKQVGYINPVNELTVQIQQLKLEGNTPSKIKKLLPHLTDHVIRYHYHKK
ncbi:DNA-binding CsgD family transcriptional regulator [Chryseobacterium rhizosphaerae]|uniref:hypothetical protein n=1 Tax=Chryseobacterium rhizosphaerae TaxID=395937 RepID=UPI0028594675|nr:hypothetical protein [Chryseobacterium rhizosphaerae]MDR6548506.1 DNA-binding CsgD family transcriptional regulator [Chryseobacterium rhizosphaerae]